ncbi:bifunctional phosphoglucose/phosphomannose isomerase [Methanomassiliicoccales archaeon LGM-DZ1]|nr:bifunctional phosphoglucose/phosphomannose isomerase [Methanomassiliicoccales archaeon LGM-DZ1]
MDFSTEQLNEMSSEVSGFVDDLEEAVSSKTGLKRKYSHILICGMGASAIGGRIYADSMYYKSPVSVDIVKTMSLPSWINKENTLLVACSYSGNTAETLYMYEKAIDMGLDVVSVTHGGDLLELTRKNGNPLVMINGKKMQPRSAIGWFIGTLGAIIEDAGGPAVRDEIRGMIPRLRRYQEDIEDGEGEAWRLAEAVDGKVPVVYGTPDMESIAVRMKNQLNENSKMVAFSGVMPEFNHNEVVGWYDDNKRFDFVPIIINDDSLEYINDIVHATSDLLKTRGLEPKYIETRGDTQLERMIYGIMFGDHVSLYLASLHSVDPCNVDPITDIKSRIKGVFKGRGEKR